MDESAYLDGCNSFQILAWIIVPNTKPAIFTATIFQFIWRWNDFYNPLIYLSSLKKFPVSLILRTFLDGTDRVYWNRALAMAMVSIIVPVTIFAFFQQYIVEGVATSGIKG